MSTYLNKAIMAALAFAALGMPNTSEAESCGDPGIVCLPPVEVDPPQFPDAPFEPPTYPGDGDGGNDGGNDGGGGSETVPTDPEACLALTDSKPHGCTQDMAGGGTPRPSDIVPQQFMDLMNNGTQLSRQFSRDVDASLDHLALCYSDVSVEPFLCEQSFVISLAIMTPPSSPDNYSAFYSGLNEITSSINWAQSFRTTADYLSIIGISLGHVEFSFGPFASFLSSLNNFNEAFYASRLQKKCEFWVQSWDQAGCSN